MRFWRIVLDGHHSSPAATDGHLTSWIPVLFFWGGEDHLSGTYKVQTFVG